MVKRKIVLIDEEKCDGCGLCIPNCPEGALQIIDGKARLVSDLFCDGLGACIGHCPKNAIRIIEREAEPYDERRVMERIVEQGRNVIKAHLEHLKEHGEEEYFNEAVECLKAKGIENPLESADSMPKHYEACACPGSRVIDFRKNSTAENSNNTIKHEEQASELRQWPVQLTLVPPNAPYFDGADLLITADCVPFAYADFHHDFLKNKALVVGCPKLDDTALYKEKLKEIFKWNNIRRVSVAHMEVPCCFGLWQLVTDALKEAGKNIELQQHIITVDGRKKG